MKRSYLFGILFLFFLLLSCSKVQTPMFQVDPESNLYLVTSKSIQSYTKKENKLELHRVEKIDEPTSSMDVLSEKQMMELIFKINCTVVVVSHRISLVDKFDKILIVKNGKIEGFDSHSRLIKNCRYYNSLYYKIKELENEK